VATVLVFLSLPLALSSGMVLYLLSFPLVAIAVLGSVWAKGWVVPDEPDLPALQSPARQDPPPEVPLTNAQLVWRATWWTLVVGGCAAFAYGPIPLKAAVLALGTLIGLYAFWRGFLSR
jgi:hypothetical protein